MTDPYPDRGAVRFVRPRALGDVVSATLTFAGQNVRALALGQLAIAGPALVLVVGALALSGTAELFAPDNPFAVDGEEVMARFGSALLLPYLALLVFSVISYGVAYGFVRAYRRGEDPAVGVELWDDVRPVLWPIVSVTLIAFLLWMMVSVVLSVGIAAMGALVSPALLFVGFAAVFVLALYAMPIWALSYPARLFETDRSGKAMQRAHALVRGRWWMAFGTLLVVGLVTFVLAIALAIPAGIVQAVLEAGGVEPSTWTRALAAAFNMLGSMLAATLLAITLSFLHGSLSAGADDTEMLDDLSRLEGSGDAARDAESAGARRDAAEQRRPSPELAPPVAEAPSAEPVADLDDAPPPPDGDAADGGFRGGGFRGGGFGP